MTIFTVLMIEPRPAIAARITDLYPRDNLRINDTTYLISANRTALDLSKELGISGDGEDFKPIGSAIIFATGAYYGRAALTIWDWIKVKLEGSDNG